MPPHPGRPALILGPLACGQLRLAVPGRATVSAMPAAPLHTLDLVLNPAARVLWRGPDSVQLELGERRVIVDGADHSTVRALLRRTRAARSSADADPPRSFDAEALDTLLTDGFVWVAPREERAALTAPSPRLAADLTALAARYGPRATDVLAGRQPRTVAVAGRSRAAVQVAALLAAAGVGRVSCTDTGDVHLSHTLPGGLTPRDEGRRFAAAAAEAIHSAAPETDTSAPGAEQPADLTVLAVDEPVDSALRDAMHERGAPHLVVRLGAGGTVGPLVLPGRTSCLRCADLHRRDRDPAWQLLAVQLTVAPARGAASEVGVAALVGALAALQALEFLDTGRCASLGATLEMHPPDWRLRRRDWIPHPDCGCTGTR